MNNKDKFWITEIKEGQLYISLDYDDDEADKYPVLFFKPNTDDFQHYHITLSKDEAKSLSKNSKIGDWWLKTLEK